MRKGVQSQYKVITPRGSNIRAAGHHAHLLGTVAYQRSWCATQAARLPKRTHPSISREHSHGPRISRGASLGKHMTRSAPGSRVVRETSPFATRIRSLVSGHSCHRLDPCRDPRPDGRTSAARGRTAVGTSLGGGPTHSGREALHLSEGSQPGSAASNPSGRSRLTRRVRGSLRRMCRPAARPLEQAPDSIGQFLTLEGLQYHRDMVVSQG